jgi:hypothetical protein
MTRVNNLYNLPKKRVAKISDDYKKLFLLYEVKNITGLKKDKVNKEIFSEALNCKIILDYENREINLKLKKKEADLDNLYQIFLVIAFLLGEEVKLLYKYENLPYFDVPHDFNFGGYPFDFINRKRLILDTEDILVKGFNLLQNENSIFSKLLPSMLSINSIRYSGVRFFAEYSILEYLSSNENTNGKDQLKEFSKELKQIISKSLDNFEKIKDNEFLNKKLEDKTKFSYLNNKGRSFNDKEKMISYIEGFDSERISSKKEYVEDWYELRNKRGLAHGHIFKEKTKKEERDRKLMKKLHESLAQIIYKEFSEKCINN